MSAPEWHRRKFWNSSLFWCFFYSITAESFPNTQKKTHCDWMAGHELGSFHRLAVVGDPELNRRRLVAAKQFLQRRRTERQQCLLKHSSPSAINRTTFCNRKSYTKYRGGKLWTKVAFSPRVKCVEGSGETSHTLKILDLFFYYHEEL